MWELDHKESWMLKNWCFWIMVLKTLESPLDCKEIQPVNPKGNQSWIFIGRTDAEAEAPILWSPDAKIRHVGKDPDAGKDWRQQQKPETEDEMVGGHHRLDGHEFEQVPGDVEWQWGLVCCSPWGLKELDMTEWLHNSKGGTLAEPTYREPCWDLRMTCMYIWAPHLAVHLKLSRFLLIGYNPI